MKRILFVDIMPIFKPGDQPPSGYNEWHEWAEAQIKAGIRQERCRWCDLWRFPQEFEKSQKRICTKCFKPGFDFEEALSCGRTLDEILAAQKIT